jgi:AcrR family transcriptional regulator
VSESRPYESPRRQKQAAETRRAILVAARQLFADQGYAATSLADVARRADVSVPTLYASVGSKAQIGLALVPFVNEEVDMPALDAAQEAASTGPELIRAIAHLVRQLNERAGDLIRTSTSMALVEPDLAAVLNAGRSYHREGQRVNIQRLIRLGALRRDLDPAVAAAILSTMTAYEVFALYVEQEGWTFDQVEAWLVDSLGRLLLEPGAAAAV